MLSFEISTMKMALPNDFLSTSQFIVQVTNHILNYFINYLIFSSLESFPDAKRHSSYGKRVDNATGIVYITHSPRLLHSAADY